MYSWLSRNLIYYPAVFLRGEPVRRSHREIERFNALSPDQMAERQLQQLTQLVLDAYQRNSYYRELFDRSGVVPAAIRDWSDFQRIPFLTKDLIRANQHRMLSQPSGKTETRKTSGSTGTPLVLHKDHQALAYMDAQMYEFYGWYGIKPGTPQARVWGMPFGVKARLLTRLKDIMLNRRRLVTFSINRAESVRYFRTLRRFRPTFMYGLINPIHEFCRELVDAGIEPAAIGLKWIITTGERQVQSKKEFVQSHFGCRVIDEYGCTELGIIAFECPAGSLHVANHNVHVEIVDPRTGAPLAAGETGEVVVTELRGYAMPLIRYRIGDLARLKSGQCECGRRTPLVAGIVGRTSELIVTPDGRRVAAAILDYSIPTSVRRFRAVQKSLDRLTIYLEMDGELSAREIDELRGKIGGYLGEEVKLEVQIVENIPLETSGKLRCFVSEIT